MLAYTQLNVYIKVVAFTNNSKRDSFHTKPLLFHAKIASTWTLDYHVNRALHSTSGDCSSWRGKTLFWWKYSIPRSRMTDNWSVMWWDVDPGCEKSPGTCQKTWCQRKSTFCKSHLHSLIWNSIFTAFQNCKTFHWTWFSIFIFWVLNFSV